MFSSLIVAEQKTLNISRSAVEPPLGDHFPCAAQNKISVMVSLLKMVAVQRRFHCSINMFRCPCYEVSRVTSVVLCCRF